MFLSWRIFFAKHHILSQLLVSTDIWSPFRDSIPCKVNWWTWSSHRNNPYLLDIHDTCRLCARFRIDGEKAMSRGISVFVFLSNHTTI